MKNIENFYSNYKNVLNVIEEKKVTATREEMQILNIYEENIKNIIPEMVKYVKSVFDSISYGGVSDYNSKDEYINAASKINQTRISNHNTIISNVKLVDMICKRLNATPLFGHLEEYENNIDDLLQKSPTDKSKMSRKALNKRQEIFEWACNIILSSINKKDANKYSDYLTNPESFKMVADYYTYLSDEEIVNFIKK